VSLKIIKSVQRGTKISLPGLLNIEIRSFEEELKGSSTSWQVILATSSWKLEGKEKNFYEEIVTIYLL
jgi:hypothetical protein